MRPRGAVRRAAGGLVAVTVLLSCSAQGEPPAATPGPDAPTPRASETTTATPSDAPTGAPTTTQPLALVAHHSRGELRLPAALLRRIETGRIDSWADLDGTTGRLEVVDSLAAVTRDRNAVALVPAARVRPWVRAAVVGGVDPLRRPAAYPIRTRGPEPGPVTTLTVAGDIMLDRGVAAAAPPGDPAAALRPMRSVLAAADLTVANLESTLSENGVPQQGGDSFAADPGVLPVLADVGIDAVSLANNHTGDYGTQALLDTVAEFRGADVRMFGAGRDLAAASRPLVLRRNGISFGFTGFNAIGETLPATDSRPGALSVRMPPRTGPLDRADLRHVLDVVADLERRVDVVVVLPHWGTQYTHVAEPIQSYVARRLAAAGADLVAGGHPHWVQGLERAGDAVVAHSLGNYLFDMDFMEQTMEGVTLTATFWDDRLMGVELLPYRMDATFTPRPATGSRARDILGDVWANSFGPFRSP